MRDLALTLVMIGLVPFILRMPVVGLLTWVWIGIMNPHRLTWGFAYSLPFAAVAAMLFMASLLLNRKQLVSFPVNTVSVSLVLFVLWLGVSPLFSFHPDYEFHYWSRAAKIQLMVLLAFLVLREPRHLHWMIWVLALSVGFFGIKGGVFTIATAGSFRTWGPSGSFIFDNNALALATIMVIPLMRYLQLQATERWMRWGLGMAIVLASASAIGSQSRGALLAIIAMAGFLWVKSRNKLPMGLLLIVLLPVGLLMMPDSWTDRMDTIRDYQEDASALGRLNAWQLAWNVAVDRFPIGAGFAIAFPDVFAMYAPDPTMVFTAHSIYFQILGEHGFVGLFLFLMVFVTTWRWGGRIVRRTAGRPELLWARDMASMCQVSLVGYAVGGAFLSLSYFDLPYYIVVVIVTLRTMVERATATDPAKAQPLAPPVPPRLPQATEATRK